MDIEALDEILNRWEGRIDAQRFDIIVNEKAVSKERPRTGRNGHVYTPKKTQDFEKRIAQAVRTAFVEPVTAPISVRIVIIESMPKGFNDLQKLLAERKMLFPTRGDLDNKVKAITDGMNGVAYIDDDQIQNIKASRRYGETDKIHIKIKAVGLSSQQIEQALYSMKATNGGRTKLNKRRP